MDVEKTAAARAALSALSDSHVRPFINTAKLARSSIFADISAMAADHALRTGDFGYVRRTLLLVGSSHFHEDAIKWFAKLLNVRFVTTKDGVEIEETKTPEERDRFRQLQKHRVGSATNTASVGAQEPKANAGTSPRSHEYLDMLDHPSRFPGSFGGGRRR